MKTLSSYKQFAKHTLFEAEEFKAKSKKTGRVVVYKSKDAMDAAIKGGSSEPLDKKKATKQDVDSDMFAQDTWDRQGGEKEPPGKSSGIDDDPFDNLDNMFGNDEKERPLGGKEAEAAYHKADMMMKKYAGVDIKKAEYWAKEKKKAADAMLPGGGKPEGGEGSSEAKISKYNQAIDDLEKQKQDVHDQITDWDKLTPEQDQKLDDIWDKKQEYRKAITSEKQKQKYGKQYKEEEFMLNATDEDLAKLDADELNSLGDQMWNLQNKIDRKYGTAQAIGNDEDEKKYSDMWEKMQAQQAKLRQANKKVGESKHAFSEMFKRMENR